jgi:hypothetical protein
MLGVVEDLVGLGASVYMCTKSDTDLQKELGNLESCRLESGRLCM